MTERLLLPLAVERGLMCYYGTQGECLSYRCGSGCERRFDRMHPCMCCVYIKLASAHAVVNRLKKMKDDWDALPVWGPDDRGLMILDEVDLESLLCDVDWVLTGTRPPRVPRVRKR